MSSRSLKDVPGGVENLPLALSRGMWRETYTRRVLYQGMDPEQAATLKTNRGRPRNPNSMRNRCIRHGILPQTFYRVRKELREMGVEHTDQDVIDIVKARRKAQ